jgi:hypothetical protein
LNSPNTPIEVLSGKPSTVGDFNGDGNFDLVVERSSYNSYSFDLQTSVLFGTGEGEFSGSRDVNVENPKLFKSADIDGDGTPKSFRIHWNRVEMNYDEISEAEEAAEAEKSLEELGKVKY